MEKGHQFESSDHEITLSNDHKNMAIFRSKKDHRKTFVINCTLSWLRDHFKEVRSSTEVAAGLKRHNGGRGFLYGWFDD